MPCNDVTDHLKIVLDADDRLQSYILAKRTCGAEVGDYRLIETWAKGKKAEVLLEETPDALFAVHPPKNPTEEFLLLKHLCSLQIGIETLLGYTPGGENDTCRIDKIEYGPEGTECIVSIKLNLVTERIKACGGCKTCRTLLDSLTPKPQVSASI